MTTIEPGCRRAAAAAAVTALQSTQWLGRQQALSLGSEQLTTLTCGSCHLPVDTNLAAAQCACARYREEGQPKAAQPSCRSRVSGRLARKSPAGPVSPAAVSHDQVDAQCQKRTARKQIKVIASLQQRTAASSISHEPQAGNIVTTACQAIAAEAVCEPADTHQAPAVRPKLYAASQPAVHHNAKAQKAGMAPEVSSMVKPPKQLPNKRRKLEIPCSAAVLDVELNKEYTYPPGQEPYRDLKLSMNENELLSPSLVSQVREACKQYDDTYRAAKISEQARYAATGGKGEGGKALSRRPDTVARKWMEERGQTINKEACAGHVPGIAVGDRVRQCEQCMLVPDVQTPRLTLLWRTCLTGKQRPVRLYYLRAVMGVVGLHYPPLGGIDCAKRKSLPPGCPTYATSVMVCGGYEDDADNGEDLVYTGQGGNDLLGKKQQIGHQQLVLGNLALVGNIQLGIPVRVTRRNKDDDSIYGCTYIYDGLYNVTKFWKETGLKGFDVYKYHLQRRPKQGQLVTDRVVFGGVGAPKTHSALATHGLVDRDLSGGKEDVPVVAVNEADEQIPAFTESERIPKPHDMKGGSIAISESARAQHRPTVEYLVCNILGDGVQQPVAPAMPAKYKGRPHDYIAYLNGGLLPYYDQDGGGKKKHRVSTRLQPVLYECGPWTGCSLGTACPQAATQRGRQYRLEVFMTPHKGWGVRSWDTIPVGAFVMEYTGRILPVDAPGSDDGQDYTFDLAPRPQVLGHEMDLPLTRTVNARDICYKLDAKREGNVARLLNHSCEPNLYVQPVLSTHHDLTMTKVCFFAAANIPPLTELTFDYGAEFVRVNLDGICHCTSASCIGARPPGGSS